MYTPGACCCRISAVSAGYAGCLIASKAPCVPLPPVLRHVHLRLLLGAFSPGFDDAIAGLTRPAAPAAWPAAAWLCRLSYSSAARQRAVLWTQGQGSSRRQHDLGTGHRPLVLARPYAATYTRWDQAETPHGSHARLSRCHMAQALRCVQRRLLLSCGGIIQVLSRFSLVAGCPCLTLLSRRAFRRLLVHVTQACVYARCPFAQACRKLRGRYRRSTHLICRRRRRRRRQHLSAHLN